MPVSIARSEMPCDSLKNHLALQPVAPGHRLQFDPDSVFDLQGEPAQGIRLG